MGDRTTSEPRSRPPHVASERERAVEVAFVSATRESPGARTPEGGVRSFPGSSFTAALARNGLPAGSLTLTTKLVAVSRSRTRGYRRTRAIPVSPRFLVDLVRSPARFFVSREYGIETLMTVIVARLRRRHALVFQEHLGRAGSQLSSFDTRYRRAVARLASALIANTPAARDEIVGSLGVDPARVFQVTMLLPPERAELSEERIEISVPRTRPLFLFIGQLIVRKNVEALVRAARELKHQDAVFEVWIGGEGPDEGRLRGLVEAFDLLDTIRFIGPVRHSSVGFVYEACDVFVMPSHADLLSVAVLEAMRFGKAVICSTGVGSAGVFARNEFNALVFDPASANQLADRMRRFVVEPDLAAEMGSRSQAIMAEHTPDAAAVAFIDVLAHISS
jgi:glycosyltransferase involved in cell wall biosynthesis